MIDIGTLIIRRSVTPHGVPTAVRFVESIVNPLSCILRGKVARIIPLCLCRLEPTNEVLHSFVQCVDKDFLHVGIWMEIGSWAMRFGHMGSLEGSLVKWVGILTLRELTIGRVLCS